MTDTFQIDLDQAEAYEQYFVPAIFEQWVSMLLDSAVVVPGDRVLDAACGTGVVARAAASRVADPSLVTGVDLNPAMLEVARRLRPDISWQEGDVSRLPFGDEEFDVALCQSALFFFPDRASAVKEMARVVRPGGRVAVQSYSPLAQQPGYGPFVETVVSLVGKEAANLLDTYWSAGDLAELQGLLEEAGLEVLETRSRLGVASFDSVDALARTEIRGTPLSELVSDATYDQIVAASNEVLSTYITAGGALRLPIRAVFVVGRSGAGRQHRA